MTDISPKSAPTRHTWLLFALLAVIIGGIYALIGRDAGQGDIIMPLDDVYIHFQYGRQMALGDPYVYNPGQPPTSGATSFVYPYILAIGYLIGFQGLNLGYWALLVGVVALFASMLAVYRLVAAMGAPYWLCLLTAVTFGLTGSIAWHFMSGMETGLMIALTLCTLLAVIERRLWLFIGAGMVLALTRPEGSLMAGMASVVFAARLWPQRAQYGWRLALLALPVVVVGLQPLVNFALTGTWVASGNQAKSILAMIPRDMGLIIQRIAAQFVDLWTQWLTGYHPQQGWFLPVFTVPTGLLGLLLLFFKRDWRWIALLILGWLLVISAAISTLDTAFWHFKRYQMPLLALFFPLSAWAVALFLAYSRTRKGHFWRYHRYAIYAFDGVVLPLFVLALFVQFAQYHHANVGYVVAQPLAMARWLNANTPQDAVVAVHDVGMMRYMGERTTLDMVGLTTPGAADAWRNGPGAVAEFLMHQQPDYIASYGEGHGYGLRLIADTPIYGEPLAQFTVDLQPHLNVALATDTQAIYQPDWTQIQQRQAIHQWLPDSYSQLDPAQLIQVGHIPSEAAYNYAWHSTGLTSGFPTEVHYFAYVRSASDTNRLVDGGRRITDYESLTLRNLDPTQGALLVTRLHPAHNGTLDIYANETLIDTQVIPHQPGIWLDVPTWIPAQHITPTTTIHMVPQIADGAYEPYQHTIYQMPALTHDSPTNPQASYQNGAMLLERVTIGDITDNRLPIDFSWYSTGQAQGDYRFFVHLYDDINQPPVAQLDMYPAGGVYPPGNWLPGTFTDSINLPLDTRESGTYTLAVGFYQPYTHERLMPVGHTYDVLPDGRLILGDVTINRES